MVSEGKKVWITLYEQQDCRKVAYESLASMRKIMDNVLDALPDNSLNYNDLLLYEKYCELINRRYFIGEYIASKGLERYFGDMIEGMVKSIEEGLSREFAFNFNHGEKIIDELRELSQRDENSILDYMFDYVDRWEMYNNLFGKEAEKEQNG